MQLYAWEETMHAYTPVNHQSCMSAANDKPKVIASLLRIHDPI